ncbi:T9SS type A sorting domain-containing protein [Aquimarina latercula]|uniref:T9SS type A sorting domain-containing protein n=1 Tax=Aquimarina latercula TaxID=987 RepID=UPI0003FEC5AF|nr:T9SS type A sorting domain-containing protein [Aquimarina latercula]
MKKKISLILLLIFCTVINAQRSNKLWDNGKDYKKKYMEDVTTTLRAKNVGASFSQFNKNIKINTPKFSKALSENDLSVNGLNIAWVKFGRDIGVNPFDGSSFRPDLAAFEEIMNFVQFNGGNVVRWWYHTNGSTNPVYDSDQMVTNNPDFFHEDVLEILDLAESKGLKVQICLWSFDMLKDQWAVDAEANRKLLTEDRYRDAYIQNALLPLVNSVGDHPGLFAWEIFNEPEGMTKRYAAHWKNFKEKVEMPFIQQFINKTAGAIRRAQPEVKITNGALGLLTNMEDAEKGFWNAYSDANLINAGGDDEGYLDFYNVHYYKWQGFKGSPFHNILDVNKIDKETVIGEYYPDDIVFNDDDLANDSGLSPSDIPITRAEDLGLELSENSWSGSIVWSWTDRSQLDDRDNMKKILKSLEKDSSGEVEGIITDGTYYINSLIKPQRLVAPKAANNNAQLNNALDYNDQKWVFKHLGENVYTIFNLGTKRFLALDEESGCIVEKTNVSTILSGSEANTKWEVLDRGENIVSFRNLNYQCDTEEAPLAVLGNPETNQENANIRLVNYDPNNQRQKWKIELVSEDRVGEAPIGETIWLRTDRSNVEYVSAVQSVLNAPLRANSTELGLNEQFKVEDAGNGNIYLKSVANNKYIQVRYDNNSELEAKSITKMGWETFTWESLGEGKVAFKTFNDKYVRAQLSLDSNQLSAISNIGNEGWDVFRWGVVIPVEESVNKLNSIDANFAAYPNPVSLSEKITLEGSRQGDIVEVYDVFGNLQSQQIIDDKNQIRIINLKKGIYYLKIESKNIKIVIK